MAATGARRRSRARGVPLQHKFERESFANLTKCFVCDELLENEVITGVLGHTPQAIRSRLPEQLLETFVPQGVGCTCAVCGVNVHERCKDKIKSPCAEVYHKFELRSYPPLSKMCYACGTTLHGLYSQGYRCSACGIDCHPGCRTNVNVKFCEAAPQRHLVKDAVEARPPEPLYEFVGSGKAGVAAADAAAGGERGSWRASLTRRVVEALPGGRSRGASGAKIQIPSSLPDMGRELRKLHTQNRAVAIGSADRWEQEVQPRLEASKRDLTKHKAKLRQARDKLASRVESCARKRTAHYRHFVVRLLTKYGGRKRAAAEEATDDLLEEFSLQRCRENEMLEQLAASLPAEAKTAIEAELQNGPCRPNGKLEGLLARLEQLNEKMQVATHSLEAVRRDLFFPKWRHWFARFGGEGTYVALGSLWLEQFQGSMAARVGMLPRTRRSDTKIPSLIIALGGFDTEFDFDAMGTSDQAPRERQKSGSGGGMRLVARVEGLSVRGNALPVSFTLDQLSLDLEFFLNVELQYIESRKRNIKGAWRLKPGAFSLKFKRFELNFRSGSINVPDALLRTVVKNVLTTTVKQSIKSAVPPEFGEYIAFLHAKAPESVRGPHSDQFRYHGRVDVAAEVDLATLDHPMESTATPPAPPKRSGFAMATKYAVRGAARLVGIRSSVTAAPPDEAGSEDAFGFKDAPLTERLSRALGLDRHQLDLFVRAQQELGLTKDSLFPDDSLRELGMKAIYGNVNDLHASMEAANKLGMRMLAGDLLSSEAPLRTVMDVVQYVLTYFGPDSKENVFTPRMVALWQGALDLTAKKMAQSQSFRQGFAKAAREGSLRGAEFGDEGSDGEPGPAPRAPRLGAAPPHVRRVIFSELVETVLRIARKRVITQLQILHGESMFGIEGLLRVSRDKMLRAAANSRGGRAMVFQLRHTAHREDSTLSGGDPDLDLDPDLDDLDDLEGEDSFLTQTLSRVRSRFAGSSTGSSDDEDDDVDDVERDAVDVPDDGDDGSGAHDDGNGGAPGFGERLRQREALIHARFEKQRERLAYVRKRLIDELHLRVDSSAGDGRFSLRLSDLDLVAPVDMRIVLGSSLFSNLARVNLWPWRRVMRAEGEDRMHLAMLRVLHRGSGPASEKYSDPDAEDTLHLEFAGVESRLESLTGGLKTVMHGHLHPKGVVGSDGAPQWSEPGRMEIEWEGADDLRFFAKMDELHAHGGLEALQDWASDMLNWSMQAFEDKKLEQQYQFLLRALVRYAQLNTFFGSASGQVACSCTADDVFLRLSNPPGRLKDVVKVQLESYFADLTDDLAKFLETYSADPGVLARTPSPHKPSL